SSSRGSGLAPGASARRSGPSRRLARRRPSVRRSRSRSAPASGPAVRRKETSRPGPPAPRRRRGGRRATAAIRRGAPPPAQAREAARKANCQSNLKQYAAATLMYIGDNDELFPMNSYLAGNCVSTFYLEVAPYVKNDQVTQCPSDRQAMDIVTMFSGFAAG